MIGGEQRGELRIFDQAVGLIVALALLVLDDAALVIEHLLGNGAEQMAHAIAFHEQRHLEPSLRHRLEIIGAIEPGAAVEVGRADLLHRLEEFARRVLGAVEHQMLEQMRETGLAGRLVLRSDIVPDADRDDRRLAVLMHDHAQAVGKREGLVGDADLLDERLHRRRGGRGARGEHGGAKRNQGEQQTAHQVILLTGYCLAT